jgi:hypothetical protein
VDGFDQGGHRSRAHRREIANLDEGAMWPTSFALKRLTAAEDEKIGALVKKVVR